MFPYLIPPDPPCEQGRPPSRLEVQQQHLDHIRQCNMQLSGDFRQSSVIPFGGIALGLRRSLGGVLISFGRWMARETGHNATGQEILARR